MDNKTNALTQRAVTATKYYLKLYKATEYYLNQYLKDNGIPQLEQLTAGHVAGERLQKLLENVGYWLANTPLQTRQNDKKWLDRQSKIDHFHRMRDLLKKKFTDHDLFNGDDNDWFSDMERSFKNECDRHKIKNNNDDLSKRVKSADTATDKPAADDDDVAGVVDPDPSKADNSLLLLRQRQRETLQSSSQNMEQRILEFSRKLQQFSVKLDKVDQFDKKLDALAAKVNSSINNNSADQHSKNNEKSVAMIALYRDNSKIKSTRIEQLQKENDHLKRRLSELLPPSVHVPAEAATCDNDDGSVVSTTDGDTEHVKKKARMTGASATDNVATPPPDMRPQKRYRHPDGVERRVPVGWKFPSKLPLQDLYAYWHIGDEINNIVPMKFLEFTDMDQFGPRSRYLLSNARRVMTMIDKRATADDLLVRGTMTRDEVNSLYFHGESAIQESIDKSPNARGRNVSYWKLNTVILYMQVKKKKSRMRGVGK